MRSFNVIALQIVEIRGSEVGVTPDGGAAILHIEYDSPSPPMNALTPISLIHMHTIYIMSTNFHRGSNSVIYSQSVFCRYSGSGRASNHGLWGAVSNQTSRPAPPLMQSYLSHYNNSSTCATPNPIPPSRYYPSLLPPS